MIYKLQNGGVVKLQNAWRRVPAPEEIEQVPTQVSTTYVRTVPIKTQFKTVRRKPTKSEKNAEEIARIVLEEVKNKSTGTASGINNKDLPLQNEYPESMLIPAVAEIKAARNIGTGLLRTAAGTIVGDEMSRGVSNIGQKIDNALSTRMFTPTFGFIGGLGGYALGSNMIGGIASGFRLPRKYRVEPINEKTYFAEDTTPKYNSNQLPELNRHSYQSSSVSQLETVPQATYASEVPIITKQNATSITDAQWDAAYNEAVRSGNIAEAQRLRDLHFVTKTPDNRLIDGNNNPHLVWHGSPENWTVFDDWKRGTEDVIYFSTDKSYADQFTIPRKNWKVGMIPNKSSRSFYLYGKNPLDIGTDMDSQLVQETMRSAWLNGENPDSVYGLDSWAPNMPLRQSNGIELGVLRRNQMKLSDPITYNDSGQIIPLSKRDDFGNPDIRYSMGNQTNLDPNRYINIEDILKDFQTGKQHALGYLKSIHKQNTDTYNKQLFKRRLRDKVPIEMELKIEENPYLRASTPMQKPNFHYNDATGSWEGEIQLIDGKWIGKDDNGFFLSNLDGNEYGKTAIIDKIRSDTDQMYLDKKADIDDSAFHEYLHRGRIANANDKVGEEFYKWKTKWLMKPTVRPYLMKPEEATANLLEIGRRAGVHTMEYPGQTKAREIIQKIINEDPVKGNMLNETRWETKPKRVWSALRGEYMGLVPLSGLGLGLMNNDK